MKYAEILLPIKFSFDKDTLTYKVPEGMEAKTGNIVKVEIKRKLVNGIILELHSKKPDFITKDIQGLVFEDIFLTSQQIEIMKEISKYYFCPLHSLLKLFLPKKILNGKLAKEKKEKVEQIISSPIRVLNEEQANCVNSILSSKENKFVIQGVTGSGKTEIYVNLAKEQFKRNKQILILVPEISLTPQTVEYFEKALNQRATVFHSKLSEGEKNRNWIKVLKGQTKMIIGSRSAIFSPFKNLGMIIIDEEHDASYKQDNAPRYHAIKIAEMISEKNPNTKIVLASATPSIETLDKLEKTKHVLKKRINDISMPEIEIVDLREEFHKRNYSIFSEKLKEELITTIKNKKQAILFINRRGSASSIVCRDCGFIIKCENCEIPMTFHEKNLARPSLICHHCGKIDVPPRLCPSCKSPHIKHLGIGTERIESELKKEFPEIKVLRADKDTTSKKNGFKDIYDKFKNHEADILVGTQMISKGLHLPLVNLVAIVLADIGLNIPDFRNNERIYQLITQVSGRAGRDKEAGKVIIQTYNPNHISLISAKNYDFENFINYERTQRKLLSNPPFSSLAKIMIEDKNQKISEEKSKKIEEIILKSIIENKIENMEINRYPAFIYKLKNKYRNILLIKNFNPKTNTIHNLLEKSLKDYKLDTNIKIDIDPLTIS